LRKIWTGFGYALLVAVAVLSLIPGPDVGGSDKLMHFLTYMLLSGWFSLIVKYPRSLWLVLVGLIFFGLLMEYLQGLTSYRMQDFDDATANSLGVMVGIGSRFTALREMMVKVDRYLHGLL
jgi:VanZ family protein